MAIGQQRRSELRRSRIARESPEERSRRLDRANARARERRGSETPQQRRRRLDAANARARARRTARFSQGRVGIEDAATCGQPQEPGVFGSLEEKVMRAQELNVADIAQMATGQHFTSDPRLALAYYYCCGVDPGAFVYGNEMLRGASGAATRERLAALLAECPSQSEVAECQRLVDEIEAESVDLWACASCGRVLLEGVHFRRLEDLSSVVLTQQERDELDVSMPSHIARTYRQLLFVGEQVYYLIPELVRDREKIPLCKNCSVDARKSKFSVACGHDYGRIGSLPVLSDAAVNCITPTRCFGVEISLSGKHCSGHSICFPSDGPNKLSNVLPDLDPQCMPRVTFIGPREEWRVQQQKYRGLYAIPPDDVYKVLSVLAHVNNIFKEEDILIEDTSDRRRALHAMEEAIHANVSVIHNDAANSADEQATSERFSADIDDGRMSGDCDMGLDSVNVRSSAVLPPVCTIGEGAAHEIIDKILETVMPRSDMPQRPVIPIKQGRSPLVEWFDNAKILAGAFPLLFLTGSGPLPSGSLPRDYVDHFMNYWDGRFEKSAQFTAMLFNQLQRHAAIQKAARAGLTHGKVLADFGKLINTVDFKRALESATRAPDSHAAVRLNAQLLRLLSLVGGNVPFSPFERASTRPKLAAMRYRYGVAQFWATIAPPEHDDLLLHRIARLRKEGGWNDPGAVCTRRECRFTDFSADIQNSARARLEISRAYPALSARVFDRRLRSFTEHIMRCHDASRTRVSRNYIDRPSGVYGRVAAFNAVVEPQCDGRLHAHFTVYGATMTPDLLTRIASCPELWPGVRRSFDSVSCTSIPRNVRNWRDDWQRAHEGKLARAFDIPAPNAAQDYDGFRAAAMKRVLSTNTHSHSSTCRKGVRGRRMCRLARPAGVFENETQPLLVQLTKASNPAKRVRATFAVYAIDENVAGNIDVSPNYDMKRLLRKPTNGAVVWEQHRPQEDELFVETNLGFACLSRSHTNSSVINGRDAGDMVEEYQQAYMTKEKGGLKSATAVMATALQDIEKFPSVAEDCGTYLRQVGPQRGRIL
ncbi:hypothetical protein DVH05_009157 [Phytophthora capsici]|nr:hypothetical protein DVH05_009157 [Phytophthora capsici]